MTRTEIETMIERLRDGCNLQQHDGERAADALTALLADLDAREVEVARLTLCVSHANLHADEAIAAMKGAEAEAARLREAMQEILDRLKEANCINENTQFLAHKALGDTK